MSKMGGVVIVILSLLAGFSGGWLYQMTAGKNATSQTASTSSSKESSTKKSLAECLKEIWGDDKYAAISANSSLATTEDNLAALKCYES